MNRLPLTQGASDEIAAAQRRFNLSSWPIICILDEAQDIAKEAGRDCVEACDIRQIVTRATSKKRRKQALAEPDAKPANDHPGQLRLAF